MALWPDPITREGLARRVAALLPAAAIRPVPAPKLHLTLAFLGEVAAARMSSLERGLAGVPMAPFEVRLDRTGWFERAGVAWVGPAATPAGLVALQSTLMRTLVEAGFEPDRRRFIPHVTVARSCRAPLHDWAGPPLDWPVDRFCLCAADAGNYRVIDAYPGAAAP